MFQITNNPVFDAEIHSQEADRDYLTCQMCGGQIYREDETYEGDSYYDFDGTIICEDCLREYAKQFRKTA